jgi:hypothetical protein
LRSSRQFRHTLQKEKDKRTPSVEHLIAELKTAVEPVPLGIHTTGGPAAGSRDKHPDSASTVEGVYR